MIKIAFLGTPDFVEPIKEVLSKNFTLIDSLDQADLAVVAAYGQILTKNQLDTPKFGCINIHPSLLPAFRGPSPIQAAILNGDKTSGITVIKMDEEVDHGPIIYQQELELSDQATFDSLSKKMFLKAAEILPQLIKDYLDGKITPNRQDHTKATFCERLSRESGYFDMNNPPAPQMLDRMIRAYYPWPGVWTKWSFDSTQDKNGKIVKFLPEEKIQMEGKKALSKKDFFNGYPDFPLRLSRG